MATKKETQATIMKAIEEIEAVCEKYGVSLEGDEYGDVAVSKMAGNIYCCEFI